MRGNIITTEYGSSMGLGFNVNGFEVSIAADNSCNGKDGEMKRFYVAVFKDNENITSKAFKDTELIGLDVIGTEENLLRAIEWCKLQSQTIEK